SITLRASASASMMRAANTGAETICSPRRGKADPSLTVVSLTKRVGHEQQALKLRGVDAHGRAGLDIAALEHETVVNAPELKLDPRPPLLITPEVVLVLPKHLSGATKLNHARASLTIDHHRPVAVAVAHHRRRAGRARIVADQPDPGRQRARRRDLDGEAELVEVAPIEQLRVAASRARLGRRNLGLRALALWGLAL